MSHQDTVVAVGDGFREVGVSYDHDGTAHRFAAIADEDRRRYGFQYHPEVDDTEHGEAMLRNFVLDVCGCRGDWTMARHIEEQADAIRAAVGDAQGLPAGVWRRRLHGVRAPARRGARARTSCTCCTSTTA